MDLRSPNVTAVFVIRARAIKAIRDFLSANGCLEIATPKIVATATEGGTALFPIAYFDREAFLNQSPQLYKQMMMAAGMDRVYEIGPIFRAEEHATRKHLNEATSIDVELSFVGMEDVMVLLENAIAYTYNYVKENCASELAELNLDLQVPKTPFRRIPYAEAIAIAKANPSARPSSTATTWTRRRSTRSARPSASTTSSWTGRRSCGRSTRRPTTTTPSCAGPST